LPALVGDAQRYRSKEELAAIREKDPIERLKRHLLQSGVPESDLDATGERARRAVLDAVERARASGTRTRPASWKMCMPHRGSMRLTAESA